MSNQIGQSTDFVQEWAEFIKRRRLSLPAIVLLEAHKPFSFIVSQFILLGQPLLDLVLPNQFTHKAIDLFSDRMVLEGLIRELEQD